VLPPSAEPLWKPIDPEDRSEPHSRDLDFAAAGTEHTELSLGNVEHAERSATRTPERARVGDQSAIAKLRNERLVRVPEQQHISTRGLEQRSHFRALHIGIHAPHVVAGPPVVDGDAEAVERVLPIRRELRKVADGGATQAETRSVVRRSR
jgi:hypothetical protein